MNPQISVLIPVYNTQKYLPKCLQSVFEQTYTNFEIIAIDDGSTDQSWTILKTYATQDERLQIFSQKNMGIAYTRNRLLEQAKGKYILFVDSDDWLSSNCLQVLFERAQKTGSDLVQGWYKEYNQQDHSYHPCDTLYSLYRGPKPPQTIKDRFQVARAYAPVWGRLMCTSMLLTNQIRCLPGKVMEDTSFSILSYLYAKKLNLWNNIYYFIVVIILTLLPIKQTASAWHK